MAKDNNHDDLQRNSRNINWKVLQSQFFKEKNGLQSSIHCLTRKLLDSSMVSETNHDRRMTITLSVVATKSGESRFSLD